MPGWLIIENTRERFVRLVNLENVSDIELWKEKEKIKVELYYGDEGAGYFSLKSWEEAEKLINTLPAIDNLGWILVRDGKVDNWRGSLAVKDVKELTEEEEQDIDPDEARELLDGEPEPEPPEPWDEYIPDSPEEDAPFEDFAGWEE